MTETFSDTASDLPPITELSKSQRRVLGVLVEKGFTTPEYYPLTLKALTAGCNQKSNRNPVTSYSEDAVADALDELHELRVAAVVHTGGGRTERFRHYARKRFTMTEPQLAIMIELLLRGRQTLGELRTRASRMVAIESLDDLRQELRGLQQMNLVQASGQIERRGVEVDHNLYQPSEGKTIAAGGSTETSSAAADRGAPRSQSAASAPPPAATGASSGNSADLASRLLALEASSQDLRGENQKLREDIDSLQSELEKLADSFDDLRRELGG